MQQSEMEAVERFQRVFLFQWLLIFLPPSFWKKWEKVHKNKMHKSIDQYVHPLRKTNPGNQHTFLSGLRNSQVFAKHQSVA